MSFDLLPLLGCLLQPQWCLRTITSTRPLQRGVLTVVPSKSPYRWLPR